MDLAITTALIHYKECFVMGSHGSLPRHRRLAMERIGEAFAYHESRRGLKVLAAPNGGEML